MEHIKRKYFLEELQSVSDFKNIRAFHKRNSSWMSFDDIAINDQEEKILNKKINTDFSRINPTNQVLFKLNHEIFVLMSLRKGTRKNTLQTQYKILQKCFVTADRSFFANHDPLTGLLNRNGAKNEFDKHLSSLSDTTDSDENESAIKSSISKIGLIAFDIDHFKQVNDSFSHDHGDVILKVFSSRLYRCVAELKVSFNYEFILSRPGGEEFELLLLGDVDKTAINAIAHEIKKRILDPALPTPEEFTKTSKEMGLEDIEKFKGYITSSIGTSIESESSKNYQKIYATLRSQADAALSKAKNDGRDCIRHYEDISRKHGKVYQHHEDSDLVVIDIGTKVGVEEGFRYKVFFPPFDGNKHIRKHDGRSEKKLGEFPKIESGELIVIQAQEHVSICEILHRINSFKFPENSSLEYVPIGTSVKFLKNPRGLPNWPACGKANDLLNSLNNKITQNELGGLISINLYSSLIKDGHLYKYLALLTQTLPSKTEFYLVNSSTLYAVVPPLMEFEEVIQACFDSITEFKTRWGAVDLDKLPDFYTRSTESLIYFCNLALQFTHPSQKSDSRITFFSTQTAILTIRSWMELGSPEDAITDYALLAKYGINNANFHNQLGLVLLREGRSEYIELSEKCFQKAINMEPNQDFYQLNLGLSQVSLEKYQEAFDNYSKQKISLDEMRNRSVSYILAYGVSAVECYKNKLGVTLKKARSIKNFALSKLPSKLNVKNNNWKQILENFTE